MYTASNHHLILRVRGWDLGRGKNAVKQKKYVSIFFKGTNTRQDFFLLVYLLRLKSEQSFKIFKQSHLFPTKIKWFVPYLKLVVLNFVLHSVLVVSHSEVVKSDLLG